MGDPTAFLDITARSTRTVEVPGGSWNDGLNLGGSCAPGIGINANGGSIVGTPEQFTLLDQFGNARFPHQISSSIGTIGLNSGVAGPGTQPIEVWSVSATGDGSGFPDGKAALADLATGWQALI